MREEALAKDTKLSQVFEYEKDPETRLQAAAKDRSGVIDKPYRYIQDYSLKGVKVRLKCNTPSHFSGAWTSCAKHGDVPVMRCVRVCL
jgi:hypothetical protein